MGSQDWERFGEEIFKIVQDAVDSWDFDRLNQTVTNTVNRAVDDVAWNVSDGMRKFGMKVDHKAKPEFQSIYYRPVLFQVPALTKTVTVFLTTVGYMGAFGSIMFLSIILLAEALTAQFTNVGLKILITLDIVLFVIFIFMAMLGTPTMRKMRRFKAYVKELNGREYCNIKELAVKIHKSQWYVTRDVKKMIKKGWFCQGHLDHEKKCLMVTDHAYNEYLELQKQRKEHNQEEKQRRKEQLREKERKKQEEKKKSKQVKKEVAQKNQKLSPEVQKIIEQGDAYIQKIHDCNEAIPGEEISAKILRMEILVDRIFERVEQNPESVSDIRKLMEYYLPTTIKLLEAYEDLDAQPVGGTNIQTAKKEIEATLDTLNVAFENLLDSLFQDTAWDVSSDISVLHTMLAQEGLTDDGTGLGK